MNAYVGITDWDWFDLLRRIEDLDEVNFWQPSGSHTFRALQPGELFLFKLHSPRNFIVGGGIFAHSSILPIGLAWETFGRANGANDLKEMRLRVEKYRSDRSGSLSNYQIGCILLEQPFFLKEERWIPIPSDWKMNIVTGKMYDLTEGHGLDIWTNLRATTTFIQQEENVPRTGAAIITYPRLGQGSFRILITDAYERRCSVTKERVLPALDAAHIKPYSEGGEHKMDNGLLLRKDIHALFDGGYITVTPDFAIEVSRKIREEFENGRDYYKL